MRGGWVCIIWADLPWLNFLVQGKSDFLSHSQLLQTKFDGGGKHVDSRKSFDLVVGCDW